MKRDKSRGYRILDKRLNGKLGILLASVNGKRYVVSIQFYFWGIQVSKKNYEFICQSEATFFFNNSVLKLMNKG